jgi:3-deoxy-D-manno-octulosonate 8-phosphate phosphatase KdsC-like HAD superfamily phosphatase
MASIYVTLEDDMTVETRDKRFGVIAVEKGFINKEQLFEALKYKSRKTYQGSHTASLGTYSLDLVTSRMSKQKRCYLP